MTEKVKNPQTRIKSTNNAHRETLKNKRYDLGSAEVTSSILVSSLKKKNPQILIL